MLERKGKVTAYSSSYALTAEAMVGGTEGKGTAYATIGLEMAQKGRTGFNWAEKIQVSLTEQEQPLFLSVLLGWQKSFTGLHHGIEHDKGFEIEHQGTKVYLKVFAKNRTPMGLPLTGPDAFKLSSLLLGQMLKNNPWLTSDSLLSMVKATVIRMADKPFAEQGSQSPRIAS